MAVIKSVTKQEETARIAKGKFEKTQMEAHEQMELMRKENSDMKKVIKDLKEENKKLKKENNALT
jgi:hypothetical protein